MERYGNYEINRTEDPTCMYTPGFRTWDADGRLRTG